MRPFLPLPLFIEALDHVHVVFGLILGMVLILLGLAYTIRFAQAHEEPDAKASILYGLFLLGLGVLVLVFGFYLWIPATLVVVGYKIYHIVRILRS